MVTADVAEKRGGGRGGTLSALAAGANGATPEFAAEPTTAEAVALAVGVEWLLAKLPDDKQKLRQTALWKLEDYTSEEIAQKLDVAVVTVERRLGRIREKWEKENPAGTGGG